jgi:hypothetical protein
MVLILIFAARSKIPYILSPGKFFDMTTQRADFTVSQIKGSALMLLMLTSTSAIVIPA